MPVSCLNPSIQYPAQALHGVNSTGYTARQPAHPRPRSQNHLCQRYIWTYTLLCALLSASPARNSTHGKSRQARNTPRSQAAMSAALHANGKRPVDRVAGSTVCNVDTPDVHSVLPLIVPAAHMDDALYRRIDLSWPHSIITIQQSPPSPTHAKSRAPSQSLQRRPGDQLMRGPRSICPCASDSTGACNYAARS